MKPGTGESELHIKNILSLVIAAFATLATITPPPATAQSVVNGNFESNFSAGCDFNMTNAEFNALVPNVTAFGDGEEMDLQTFGCFIDPDEGDWCIALGYNGGDFRDEIALRLSEPLIVGETYTLLLSAYRQDLSTLVDRRLQVGLSETELDFGLSLTAESLPIETWSRQAIVFVATTPASFVTFRIEAMTHTNNTWISLDAVSIFQGTGIFDDGFESGTFGAWSVTAP